MRASVNDNVAIAHCPGCGSVEFEATGPEASGFFHEFGGRQFQQDEYCVRECLSCGLLYRTPTLSDDTLADYYAVVPFQRWEAKRFNPIERAVLSILKSLPPGSRILDYGCSSGRLLSTLCHDYECYGSEINPVAANEASSRGLRMIEPTLLTSPMTEKFDAIVLVDVFEHLRKPVVLLRQLVQHLKPDALLGGRDRKRRCGRVPARSGSVLVFPHPGTSLHAD